MSQRYVPRSKDQRAKLTDNRPALRNQRGTEIVLTCGCKATTLPPVSNPDQWFCHIHGGLRRAK